MNDRSIEAPPIAALRALALTLYAPSLLVAIGQQAVLIMLPLYAVDLGGGAGLAATFLGLNGIGRMTSALPSGAAISRFGDRRTMIGGLLAILATTLALALVARLWAVAMLALVFGAGIGAWMLARLHYLAEQCPISHRGRAMTVLAGLHRLGALVGPALGGLTAHYLGYRILFLGAGALALVGMALVWRHTARTPVEKLASHHPFTAIGRVVRQNRTTFARAGSATVALQFVRAGRQLLVPLWGHHIGLDTAQIGLVFSLSSAVDACMFYPAGYIMDRWGRKWAMAPSLLTLGGTLGMLTLAHGFWSYLAVALLAGLGNGLGTGIVMTLGADLSPARHRGEFLGVWRLIGDMGSALGPFLMAAAATGFALTGALLLNLAIGGAGAVIMIAAVRETVRGGRAR